MMYEHTKENAKKTSTQHIYLGSILMGTQVRILIKFDSLVTCRLL